MKLRTKIFLLLGGLFLASFVVAQVLEDLMSSRMVSKTEALIESKIRDHNNDKREAAEIYMRTQVEYAQAETEALIDRIKSMAYWTDAFRPTKFNLDTNTWLSAATLLINNKRLDLIQNINNEKLSSCLILDEPPPYHVLTLPFVDDLKLCVVDSQAPGKKLDGPYIGIPFPFNRYSTVVEADSESNAPQTNFYLLFDPEVILKFDPVKAHTRFKNYEENATVLHTTDTKLSFEQIHSLTISLESALRKMKKGQNYLKLHPELADKISRNKQEWFEDQFQNHYDVVSGYNELYDIKQVIIDRYDQINMIWQLLALNATGINEYNPLGSTSPVGIAHTFGKEIVGRAILREAVFFDKPVDKLTAEIFEGDQGRVFIGRSIGLEEQHDSEINEGTLTLGVDIRSILRGLTVASEEYALLTIDDRVIKAFDDKGEEFRYEEGSYPVHLMTKNQSGLFKDKKGTEYYYITIQPLNTSRVRLVLFNTRHKEFALVNIAGSAAQQLNRMLSFQMAVIGFITLSIVMLIIHILSKRITTPIIMLSESSRKVEEGDLEGIDLPDYVEGSKDEIADLYHSFYSMVRGLKEKEKVKGVLNKVVSPEIANKILEGEVELGGEERVVTVLFADIRHFTELTEKVAPSEVIQTLNEYMTLLSKVIDDHHGVIDKYVGDQIMALFGAPLSSEDSATQAVLCALDMIRKVEEHNLHNKAGLDFSIGIGVHTGNVVAGNMGAESRMNYTVLGANVNLAARLCSKAQEMQVLISKETLEAEHIQEIVESKELDPVELKGFSRPVPVYQVFSKEGDQPDQ